MADNNLKGHPDLRFFLISNGFNGPLRTPC